MKKIIILTLLLTIISCSKKVEVKSKKLNERYLEIVKKEMSKKAIDLKGKYDIVSIEVFPDTQEDTPNKYAKTIYKNGYKFNFNKKEGIVKLDAAFGMQFFGDTIFNYKIEEKFILLKNNNKKIELPYINDAGIIRFQLNKNGIKQVTIRQPKN